MIRTRAAEYGKGMAAVAFLLFWTALALSSHKLGVGFWLWIVGWVFFGSGGGMLPWRDTTTLGRVVIVLGSALMVLAAVWPWVYKEPWLIPLAGCVAAVASVLAILGGWVYLRAATKAES